MNFRPRMIAALFAAALLLPAAAAAQEAIPHKLEAGIWTGVVVPPNEDAVNVTYEVSYRNDTVSVMLNTDMHGQFKLDDIQATPQKITFYFTPGPRLLCVLNAVDTGGFAGQCTDEGGTPASITMLPPRKEPKS